jgi:hypothetical protein
MQLGNFAVKVTPGREGSSGYVSMSHNSTYTIQLSNFGKLNCDAEIKVDGKQVGTWRIPPKQSITLERPVHDTGRFTFYQFGTPEAEKVGLIRCPDLGLISVLFKPEKLNRFPDVLYQRSPGGTGLSGESEQRFTEVSQLNYDKMAFVSIHLRLVCDNEEPRPLTPISTPVPPPLE